nr:hypothetical protein 14 [bacterium]
MKAKVNYEPSISIEWTANEKDVIKRTLTQLFDRRVFLSVHGLNRNHYTC